MDRTPAPTRSRTRAVLAAAAFVSLSGGIATAVLAQPTGTTSATWSADCSTVTVTSTKDISNIVFVVDGFETKIEFADGTNTFDLDGAASDVWVKAGNNKSGDGSGFGEHYARPASCDSASSGAVEPTATEAPPATDPAMQPA